MLQTSTRRYRAITNRSEIDPVRPSAPINAWNSESKEIQILTKGRTTWQFDIRFSSSSTIVSYEVVFRVQEETPPWPSWCYSH